jgi:hypothetical protein
VSAERERQGLPVSPPTRRPATPPAGLLERKCSRQEADKLLYQFAHDPCKAPGEPGFVLGGLMTPPASDAEDGGCPRLLPAPRRARGGGLPRCWSAEQQLGGGLACLRVWQTSREPWAARPAPAWHSPWRPQAQRGSAARRRALSALPGQRASAAQRSPVRRGGRWRGERVPPPQPPNPPSCPAELVRLYLRQCREEAARRLVARCYSPDGRPDKFWLAFGNRKFLNKLFS